MPVRSLPALATCFLFGFTPLLPAEEIELDLSKAPRIYSAEGAMCETAPDEGGTGLRMNYNFENSTGDWAHFSFPIPPISSPLKKITVTARGTPVATMLAVRGGTKGAANSLRFGPPVESDFQTFELDFSPGAKSEKGTALNLEYPINTVLFQIKATNAKQGYLEVSKIVIETE